MDELGLERSVAVSQVRLQEPILKILKMKVQYYCLRWKLRRENTRIEKSKVQISNVKSKMQLQNYQKILKFNSTKGVKW